MHQIDNPTAAGAEPTYAAAGTPGFFASANPGAGQEATIVARDWLNAVQKELVTIVTRAGLALTKGTAQVWQALELLFFSTGDIKATLKTVAGVGWVMMNDGTIGSAASGATRPGADTAALYTLLWTNLSNTNAPVTGGRGASAAADFAANKPIRFPLVLGRALVSAGAGATLTARTLGAVLGEEKHLLLEPEMPIHSHVSPGSSPGNQSTIASGNPQNTTVTTGPAGGNVLHNIMQPSTFVNYMIKL